MDRGFDYRTEPLRDILFIDVKSFYASVECALRGWDPLTKMLVVMSTADNTGNGLILASSPMAKAKLGITNVTRADNLPDHPDLVKVPPRMNLYIKENVKFNNIFREYVADEDLLIYSIDESILDVTASMKLFFPDPTLSRSQKRRLFAQQIQAEVKNKLGLVLTVGIGDNPLLAKLALDNAAKHNQDFVAEWRYENIPETVWQISNMRDFWGIGRRMQQNFYKLGIDSIYQLAHTDPELLRQRFGVLGQQYYYHANGIDRTLLSEQGPLIKEKSYGNSQVLPKNYVKQQEIEIVVKEMAEQVAARIRRHGCLTQCIHLFIGTAQGESKSGFSHQMKIPATDNTKQLASYCLQLFRKYYRGQVVRHVGITYSKLLFTNSRQLSLFESPEKAEAEQRLDQIIDQIREKYGFTAIVHATSKLEGARSIPRSHLVGGHAGGAGGLDGL
ncbi:Y-family DNA polymerase [Candidatus Enterococcus leclercqii]|uniref:Y-family DNA polymerase n=1 Tax=Candidatus Enterococcus leclercqii TaxID=1857218 RepID=UPI00137B50F9|nr:Y-family DNA polymerase [Enterococcus sp. CU9D]KAF1291970.1 excinuclease ABC subunit A [Enterococcus sp. CU9D]